MAYVAAASALMMSCSTNEVFEKEKDITESRDLMRFRNIDDNYQVTRTDYSIPNLLKQNFMVSCYKNFGNANQQEVMPMYEANYEDYNSVYGQVSWNYISSESNHLFYQEQYEKYWDYSAYPYRFFAVTPAPIQNGVLNAGFSLTDKHLNVPMRFEYQTCTDGKTTPGAEPCLVAEVERDQTGHDFDLLAKADDGTYPKEINASSQTMNRTVALPFHHLNCKVRFGIYCPVIGEGEEHEVKDVKIKVSSPNFITSAKYNATLGPSATMMDGTFSSPNTSNGVLLLEVTPEAIQHGNELYHEPLTDDKAAVYWFECPNGLMQVPQEDVKLSISFSVKGKFEDPDTELIGDFDGEYTNFKDVAIVLKDTKQDTYTWEKNKYYTYYVILGPFTTTTPQFPIVDGEIDMFFTCVEEPWEDVEGSMETDLED